MLVRIRATRGRVTELLARKTQLLAPKARLVQNAERRGRAPSVTGMSSSCTRAPPKQRGGVPRKPTPKRSASDDHLVVMGRSEQDEGGPAEGGGWSARVADRGQNAGGPRLTTRRNWCFGPRGARARLNSRSPHGAQNRHGGGGQQGRQQRRQLSPASWPPPPSRYGGRSIGSSTVRNAPPLQRGPPRRAGDEAAGVPKSGAPPPRMRCALARRTPSRPLAVGGCAGRWAMPRCVLRGASNIPRLGGCSQRRHRVVSCAASERISGGSTSTSTPKSVPDRPLIAAMMEESGEERGRAAQKVSSRRQTAVVSARSPAATRAHLLKPTA